MPQRLARNLALVALALSCAAPALAEWKQDANLFTVDVGLATARIRDASKYLTAGTVKLAYDNVDDVEPRSFGADAYYIRGENDLTEDGERVHSEYRSFRAHVGFKYWFGKPSTKGYVGAGVGLHFSELDRLTESGASSTTDIINTSMNAPVGFNTYLTENVFVDMNMTADWMGQSVYTGNWNFIFNVGVGWKL